MNYLPYLVAILIFLVDQLIKSSAVIAMNNSGVAFGAFANSQTIVIVLNLIILGILAAISIFVTKSKQIKSLTWMVIIIAASNLLDRLTLGHVIDYLQVGPIVFNLSDLSITILILLILWQLYIRNESRSNTRKSRR